jgi:hypothetical protein
VTRLDPDVIAALAEHLQDAALPQARAAELARELEQHWHGLRELGALLQFEDEPAHWLAALWELREDAQEPAGG